MDCYSEWMHQHRYHGRQTGLAQYQHENTTTKNRKEGIPAARDQRQPSVLNFSFGDANRLNAGQEIFSLPRCPVSYQDTRFVSVAFCRMNCSNDENADATSERRKRDVGI